MACLHNEYLQFDNEIKLTTNRKERLKASRKKIKERIRKYFSENKKDEIQPKFKGQGSFEMNTTVNPIPITNDEGKTLLKYDLDYGVYFIEKEGENKKRSIHTWHDWVYDAVDDHTDKPTKDKDTCVRVVFADGHHIDLPIYYTNSDTFELAHKKKGWLVSDPKSFYEWFNEEAKKDKQLEKIVRYLKAWKNYRETTNTNLKLPSGFELTILATNNFIPDDRNDIAFRKTVDKMLEKLKQRFECLRPTTPKDENVFEEYIEPRKNNFLDNLEKLLNDCNKAIEEKNFKKASEYLRNQFGDRFPFGNDIDEDEKSKQLAASLTGKYAKPYFDNKINNEPRGY